MRAVKDSTLVQPAAVHSLVTSPLYPLQQAWHMLLGYSSSWQRRNPIEMRLSSRFWTLAKRWLSTAGDHLAANIGCERAKDVNVGKDDDSTGGDPRHSTKRLISAVHGDDPSSSSSSDRFLYHHCGV